MNDNDALPEDHPGHGGFIPSPDDSGKGTWVFVVEGGPAFAYSAAAALSLAAAETPRARMRSQVMTRLCDAVQDAIHATIASNVSDDS